MLSPFLPYLTISLHALSLSITEFCTSPSGIVLCFLRRQRLQLVQHADAIARIKPFVQFFSLLPLVEMSPTFLLCITVDFAASTSFTSESSNHALHARFIPRTFASFAPGVRLFAMLQPPSLSPRCVPALPPFFESITRLATRR